MGAIVSGRRGGRLVRTRRSAPVPEDGVAERARDRPQGHEGGATPLSRIELETHERLEPLAAEWDELADRVGASPFLRPGWIAAWWRAFGRGRLEVLALREAGRLVAIVPLERRRGALRSPTNWHSPEFGLVAEERAAPELARALFERGARRIQLAFLDSESGELPFCRGAAARAGYRLLERPYVRSPYLAVDGDWEAYEAGLATKVRSELRRRRRRLEEEGDVTLDVEDGERGLDELLAEGFRVEAAGWKGKRGSAVVSGPATQGFYAEVARWASERGWLRLAFLRLDAQALAFDFSLEGNGVHYLVKTGFDPARGRFAPGMLLRHAMLARSYRDGGLRSYEFLGAAEPWKLEWTQTLRERLLLQAFAPSVAGSVDRAAFVYGRPLAKRALAKLRQ